mgnify:CR=1 FL=1|jgi:hypothetical protein
MIFNNIKTNLYFLIKMNNSVYNNSTNKNKNINDDHNFFYSFLLLITNNKKLLILILYILISILIFEFLLHRPTFKMKQKVSKKIRNF